MKLKKIITTALVTVMVGASLVACGGKDDAPSVNVKPSEMTEKIMTELQMGKMNPADEELAKNMFHLNLDDVEEYSLNMPLMNIRCDEIDVVKAKDGKVESVKASMEKRRDDIVKQWERYLPDQYALVKESKVIVQGNYVALLIANSQEMSEEVDANGDPVPNTESIKKAEEIFNGYFK
ncbi:MAG: DUF4358 domain-containing protein [Clostridium sp.]